MTPDREERREEPQIRGRGPGQGQGLQVDTKTPEISCRFMRHGALRREALNSGAPPRGPQAGQAGLTWEHKRAEPLLLRLLLSAGQSPQQVGSLEVGSLHGACWSRMGAVSKLSTSKLLACK